MNQEPTQSTTDRSWRWRKLFVALLVVIGVTGFFIRPYVWTKLAPFPSLDARQLAVPPMSMAEYMEVVGDHPRPYLLKYTSGKNELHLFGISHHTNDPQDADILQIKQLLEQQQPNVCLIEGRLGVWLAGYEGIIRKFGESGLVSWYARKNRVPAYSLELSLEEEVKKVVKSHQPEHVALFYVLRPYFGARRAGPMDDPEAFIAESLRKRTAIPGIDKTFKTVAEMDEIWKKDFADLPDWRDCDDRQGWPGTLAEVGDTANRVRNEHWLAIFDSLMTGSANTDQQPKKIFVVVGCSHAVRLQPSLDAMFKPNESNPKMSDWKKKEAADPAIND